MVSDEPSVASSSAALKRPRHELTVPERLKLLEDEFIEMRKVFLATQGLIKRHDGLCNHYYAFRKTLENSTTPFKEGVTFREHFSEFFDNPQFANKAFDGLIGLARKAQDQDYRFQQRQNAREVTAELSEMDADGKSGNLH